MLTLAHLGALTDPHALAAQPVLVRSLLALAALVGFGTKAGLMPLHSWLPRAHPAAPGHVLGGFSAIISKGPPSGALPFFFFFFAPPPPLASPLPPSPH